MLPNTIRFILLAAVIALANFASPAAAQTNKPSEATRARAKAHFERAEKLFSLSRFDDALVAFEAAYNEVPAYGLLFNIAQCHRHIGNLDKAIFAYEKYLYHLPNARNRKQVERTVVRLKRERDRRAAQKRGLTSSGPPGDTPPRRSSGKAFYKEWWFIAGSIVVVGAATAVVVTSGDDLPDSDLGVLDFSK